MKPRYDPRVFLALPLSRITQEKLGVVQEQLRPQLKNWHWIPAFNFHVTLRFFGEVREEQLREIQITCRELGRNLAPFQFNINRVDYFGKAEHARVLFATGEISSGMLSLVKAIAARFPDNSADQRREFRPHITLAKARKYMEPLDEALNARVLQKLREQGAGLPLDMSTVHREFVLMETVWVGRVVEYEVRERYNLELLAPV